MMQMMRVIEKVTGREITPDEKIWLDYGSEMVQEMSRAVEEEYGVTIPKGILQMAESPTSLLKIMRMGLLNADQYYQLAAEPGGAEGHLTLDTHLQIGAQIPIEDYFLKRVVFSECSVCINEVKEFHHSGTDIAIIGIGGFFAGQFLKATPTHTNTTNSWE